MTQRRIATDPRLVEIMRVAVGVMDQLAESQDLDEDERELGREATHKRMADLFDRHGVHAAGGAWLIWATFALHGRPERTWGPLDGDRVVDHARAVLDFARRQQPAAIARYVDVVLAEGDMDLLWAVSAVLAVAAADSPRRTGR